MCHAYNEDDADVHSQVLATIEDDIDDEEGAHDSNSQVPPTISGNNNIDDGEGAQNRYSQVLLKEDVHSHDEAAQQDGSCKECDW
eukprot:gene2405-2769_t